MHLERRLFEVDCRGEDDGYELELPIFCIRRERIFVAGMLMRHDGTVKEYIDFSRIDCGKV